ncbi:MAG: hypothetical protein AAF225_02215 [Pseudomonadota bacterium]
MGAFSQLSLTPMAATLIFVLGVVAGYQYRRNWKLEGPVWKAWLFGGIAGLCLVTVAFVPMAWGIGSGG